MPGAGEDLRHRDDRDRPGQGRPGQGDVQRPCHAVQYRSAERLHDHRRGQGRRRRLRQGRRRRAARAETATGRSSPTRSSAQVGGKLAQIGARLIDATAKQMADQFFGAFAAKVGGPDAALAVADENGETAVIADVINDPEVTAEAVEERARSRRRARRSRRARTCGGCSR